MNFNLICLETFNISISFSLPMKTIFPLCALLASLPCVKAENSHLYSSTQECTALVQVYLPAKGEPVYTQGLLRHSLADSQGRLVHDIRWENPGQPFKEHFIYEIPLVGDEPLQMDLEVRFYSGKIIKESLVSPIPNKCR